MEFKISDETIQQIEELIATGQEAELLAFLKDIHAVDIAEIMNELHTEEAIYIFDILDSEVTDFEFHVVLFFL